MNTATLLGIGTSCPPNTMSQADALKMFTDIVCEDERQKRLAQALYRKSGVKNRHTVIPHRAAYTWGAPVAEAIEVGGNQSSTINPSFLIAPETLPDIIAGESAGPTTGERMQIFRKFAGGLAEESAVAALSDARLPPEEITHLIVVTCTGFDSPGVDIHLINRLGLPRTTQRVNVGFMGCHAAINGIRAAMAIAQADPHAKVLMTAVELCSLHYRFQWDLEGIIGNALFADGSASIVVGGRCVSDRKSPSTPPVAQPSITEGWHIAATGSVLIPNSSETMSWTVGDNGFEMLLTNEVGDRIEATLKEWLVDWLLKYDLTMDNIDLWGVHPGGPRILAAVQGSLALGDDDLATSRSVLQRYGNMSSPTVLFILREFLDARGTADQAGESANCLLLAFGPGLVAEIALLKR
ncbi:type III polyketide synthase [Aureliella helgolandensis]|uniref:Alpha-pyrone synthesis polyketide synthase-like Pks18 n=1 Tax=Aureliella helgolandensis TaxID=2527968 RepID=A0A518G8M4_9BACT|nr:type III polyketide synthase [Aureliella helgolandensis]QDV24941.1 Alpha-pyrone synthesis polyketide synthase-like Pks18 [Aureliella helgolandensis]